MQPPAWLETPILPDFSLFSTPTSTLTPRVSQNSLHRATPTNTQNLKPMCPFFLLFPSAGLHPNPACFPILSIPALWDPSITYAPASSSIPPLSVPTPNSPVLSSPLSLAADSIPQIYPGPRCHHSPLTYPAPTSILHILLSPKSLLNPPHAPAQYFPTHSLSPYVLPPAP